jgi:hypothetical protein
MIIGMMFFYGLPMAYIIIHRNEPTLLARSPLMIIICSTLLYMDTLSNTVIFQLNKNTERNFICKYGAIEISIFFQGFCIFYIIRMYRMYKFYRLYEQCLINKSNANHYDKKQDQINKDDPVM